MSNQKQAEIFKMWFLRKSNKDIANELDIPEPEVDKDVQKIEDSKNSITILEEFGILKPQERLKLTETGWNYFSNKNRSSISDTSNTGKSKLLSEVINRLTKFSDSKNIDGVIQWHYASKDEIQDVIKGKFKNEKFIVLDKANPKLLKIDDFDIVKNYYSFDRDKLTISGKPELAFLVEMLEYVVKRMRETAGDESVREVNIFNEYLLSIIKEIENLRLSLGSGRTNVTKYKRHL